MLDVTLLLIIICVRDVIAVSIVIIVPGVCTLVMLRLFCHVSIFLIIRKYKYMQRMHGGGPKMQCQLYQPNYLTYRPESSEADPGVGGVFTPETWRHILFVMGGCVGV